MAKSQKSRRLEAFSLLELLISIGIIAVLAALIFPGLKAMQVRADRTRCLSNLRQIGTATLQYTADHEMQFPGPLFTGLSGKYWTARVTSIQLVYYLVPYLGLPQPKSTEQYAPMFYCPALLKAVNNDKEVASYSAVREIFGYPSDPKYPFPVKITSIPSLSATYVLSDFVSTHKLLPAPAHPLRNLFFLDGHMESRPWGF